MAATSSSQQTIYRSVPPRPLSYGLSDMLDPRVLGYVAARHRSSTAPVSGNTPEEFAQRFKARPTTRPRVIEFDGSTVTRKGHGHRSPASPMSNGFPMARAKIYIGQPKTRSPSEQSEYPTTASTSRTPHPTGRVQLLTPLHTSPGILVGGTEGGTAPHGCHTPASPAPLPAAHVTHKALQGNQQPHQQLQQHPRSDRAAGGPTASTAGSAKTSHHRSHSSSNSGSKRVLSKSASSLEQKGEASAVRSSTASLKPPGNLRDTSQSAELVASIPRDLQAEAGDHIHNPELLLTSSTDCDDLTALPPPKKVLPKREVPWVFRYKVKRGMNTLSRIMASKPSHGLIHAGQAFI